MLSPFVYSFIFSKSICSVGFNRHARGLLECNRKRSNVFACVIQLGRVCVDRKSRAARTVDTSGRKCGCYHRNALHSGLLTHQQQSHPDSPEPHGLRPHEAHELVSTCHLRCNVARRDGRSGRAHVTGGPNRYSYTNANTRDGKRGVICGCWAAALVIVTYDMPFFVYAVCVDVLLCVLHDGVAVTERIRCDCVRSSVLCALFRVQRSTEKQTR